jgi:murein DD-endopeptidase MepM/ murein hydrolase activator NlpD
VQTASVSPAKAFVGAPRGIQVAFKLEGTGPTDVLIRVVGAEKEVRQILVPQVVPEVERVEAWDGLSNTGRAVPDGSYRVLVAAGGAEREAGSVLLRNHLYPVRARHGARGGVGEFGAGRNGGRVHRGFDVTANCGTPLAAVRAGVVVRNAFHPRLDGNYVIIRGVGERQTYRYSHLIRRSRFERGEAVQTGDILGHVGRTGNAGGTPCHLHFEIRRQGRWIDPEPQLRRWDRFS